VPGPAVAVVPLKLRGAATDQFLSVSLAEALIHRLSSTGKPGPVNLTCCGCEGFGGQHLFLDPGVGPGEAVAELDRRCPVEFLLDESVVAVAAVDALGSVELVVALELDARDLFRDVDELVDGDEFVGAEVEGLVDVALCDHLRSLGAVIDVHEGAGLFAVAPDLDLVGAGVLGLDDFAADGGGSLLAAAGPGAERAVDVVIAGDAGLETIVFFEVAAHALGKEFLPAVAVFRECRVGVLFLERDDVGVGLLFGVVDAGGGGVEEALDTFVACGHDHVGVGENAQHAEGLVVFDEAHAAHVGGKLEDDIGARGRLEAAVFILEVELEAFDVFGDLVPLVEGFDIDGAYHLNAIVQQTLHEMAADKSAGTTDDCFLSFELHSGEGSFGSFRF
jgi:hypothetical protein